MIMSFAMYIYKFIDKTDTPLCCTITVVAYAQHVTYQIDLYA